LENAVASAEGTTLEQYKRMFADARDLLADNRKEQQIDDDYYHGYQLTPRSGARFRPASSPTPVSTATGRPSTARWAS
jgi:hypothetical protein